MRRSPPQIDQTAVQEAIAAQKSLKTAPFRPQSGLKRQHRRSRRRYSDVP